MSAPRYSLDRGQALVPYSLDRGQADAPYSLERGSAPIPYSLERGRKRGAGKRLMFAKVMCLCGLLAWAGGSVPLLLRHDTGAVLEWTFGSYVVLARLWRGLLWK